MRTAYPPHRLELRRKVPPGSYLHQYKRNHYSQNGEDGVILRIAELLEINTARFVEFGAHNGIDMSNCRNLLLNHGWCGVFIEGNQTIFSDLLRNYYGNSDVLLLNYYVSGHAQSDESLDNILKKHSVPTQDIEIVSIDVDSIDYHIFDSIHGFNPSLYIIEFNPTIANDIYFVQANTSEVMQGCSLLALTELARQKQYELVAVVGANAFFVRIDLFPKLGLSDNSIDNLYAPSYDGRLFCGFDSYIHTLGLPVLHWSGVSIDSSDIQVHPDWRIQR